MHLVDTTMFFSRESGGVKRYLLAKRNWLAQQAAVTHTLLVPGGGDELARNAISTLRSPTLPFANGYRFPVRLPRWRDALIDLEPDLIEAGDPYATAWAALSAGRRLGIPVVGFYHSDLPRLVSARIGGALRPVLGHYIGTLYNRFDLVLAPSLVMVEKLRSLGLRRVVQQPLGVDIDLFNPRHRDPALRAALGLDPDTRLVVFAGRFAREKHIPILLEAFRRVGSRYHLLLIGSEERIPRRQCNATVWPYQGPDLPRLVASCDALVHAGDQETFGLVVLEAMASGIPVVGVRAGAVAELVDETVGLLAVPGDARSVAANIEALYERDIGALGRAARKRVEREYSWDRVMRALLRSYASLTGAVGEPEPVASHAAG